MIPSSVYHVDNNTLNLHIIETGRLTAPFHSIQQAIDDGYAHGIMSLQITVAPGTYPDPIIIYSNMMIVVKGTISALCILGDVTFNTSGNYNFAIGAGTNCSFNDVIIQNVNIMDSDQPSSNNNFVTKILALSEIYYKMDILKQIYF